MTPDVLIPRLETECLVRRARQILQSTNLPINQPTIVVDIGSGSGIIGTSVADLADEVIFLDISSEALRVTEENFRTQYPDKKAQFIVSDLLENLLEKGGAEERGGGLVKENSETPIHTTPLRYNSPLEVRTHNLSQGSKYLFLTNLPYIRDADWKNMSADTIYEPKLALFGGEQTGFEIYEKLFEQFSHLYQSATLQSYHPTILFEF